MASMGIYIFNWDVLKQYLILDHEDPESFHDFGRNILPRMLDEDLSLYAYGFDGYWRDVGTVESYWQANMDLLDPQNSLNLFDSSWRIYTKNYDVPPQFISDTSTVENALINEGCVVYGTVKNSILSTSVTVEEGAVVEDSILLPGVHVKKGAHLKKVIVLSHEVIEENEKIGDGELFIFGSQDLGLIL